MKQTELPYALGNLSKSFAPGQMRLPKKQLILAIFK